jgi:hypothetical protein
METLVRIVVLLLLAVVLGLPLCVMYPNLHHDIKSCSRSCIRRGLLISLATSACVFALTYLIAWVAFRPIVSVGQAEPGYSCSRLRYVHRSLAQYNDKHGRYPTSLREAFPPTENMDYYVDPWHRPCQYAKTDHGYRLFSLGRDGKPGGQGLDGDFDFPIGSYPDVQITFSQFLFEGTASGDLFSIALLAGILASLACFAWTVSTAAADREKK